MNLFVERILTLSCVQYIFTIQLIEKVLYVSQGFIEIANILITWVPNVTFINPAKSIFAKPNCFPSISAFSCAQIVFQLNSSVLIVQNFFFLLFSHSFLKYTWIGWNHAQNRHFLQSQIINHCVTFQSIVSWLHQNHCLISIESSFQTFFAFVWISIY